MKAEHVRADINQPPPSSTFTGLDKCERQNKPDQIRSGESAVISHEMQFIRPHLLMKQRKMRCDNRSRHTILVSVEFFFSPDTACEVLQKPLLPWGLQDKATLVSVTLEFPRMTI